MAVPGPGPVRDSVGAGGCDVCAICVLLGTGHPLSFSFLFQCTGEPGLHVQCIHERYGSILEIVPNIVSIGSPFGTCRGLLGFTGVRFGSRFGWCMLVHWGEQVYLEVYEDGGSIYSRRFAPRYSCQDVGAGMCLPLHPILPYGV